MDEGRGIYSVAMFHKETGQAARRLPCFLPFTSAKRVAAPNNGGVMPTSPRSAKRCHSEFVGADDSVRPCHWFGMTGAWVYRHANNARPLGRLA